MILRYQNSIKIFSLDLCYTVHFATYIGSVQKGTGKFSEKSS